VTQAALSNFVPPQGRLRDRLLALRSQPIFAPVDDDGLLLVAEHARSTTYRDGEIVVPEGEPQQGIFVVTEGSLLISQQGRPLVTVNAGTAFGTIALLARKPSALAVAGGETRTIEVPGPAFEGALDANHSLLRGALAVTGAELLKVRGNLPIDPSIPRELDEGPYYLEPKSMVERLLQLRSGPFGYMNLEALIDLARQMIEVRYPAGHLLWSAGDLSTHSLHIDHGRVRCTAPDGRHVDVARGFNIGVMDVWGARQRAYDARTETSVIGHRIAFESFLTLLESHVEVGLEVLRGFARALLTERTSPPRAPAI
jgi:CRP-like cAMP-binding protein